MLGFEIDVQQDSNNFNVKDEFIKIIHNKKKDTIRIILNNPEREIEVSYNDFYVAFEAIKLHKLMEPELGQIGEQMNAS